MINKKNIFKIGAMLLITSSIYITSKNIYKKLNYNDNNLATIEDLVKETNFKLDFKNINELEYALQDSIIETKNTGINKTFSNNNKFDILTNDNSKIISISFTSRISEIDNNDIDYLQKIYNLTFDNLSSFIFKESNEVIEKTQKEDYINSNKYDISNKGYTIESINLNKTSEIKITTYYQKIQQDFQAYKISLDIFQGNKW